jgi:hypothetical protein
MSTMPSITPEEALRLLADLLDDRMLYIAPGTPDPRRIRAILAQVEPTRPDPRLTELQDALARVVEKAVVHGEDEDGFIQGYIMGTGAIHNAIRVLQNRGIHVRPHGVDDDALAGVLLTREEAALAAEAFTIAQESLDDCADQFSAVDARLDEGKTRADAARMRALAARLGREMRA